MYTFLGLNFRRWFLFLWPLSFFLRVKIFPKSLTKENFDQRVKKKSVIYILPRMSVLDVFVINRALKQLKQPLIKGEASFRHPARSSMLAIRAPGIFFQNDDKSVFVQKIVKLLRLNSKHKEVNYLFFPVSVYWSRAAERDEKGFVLRSLFPDDGTGNFLQKLWMLLLHRGEVSVSFGKEIEIYLPKSNQKIISHVEKNINDNLDLLYARRLQRQLLIEFAKEKTSFLGPVLYEQDKITQWILSSEQTKKFLMHSEQPEKTKHQIEKYIREIAANYKYSFLRAAEKLFDFVWTKVFTGIRVRNYDKVERLIKDNCVIWMPCHRSHFDYLLLNYLLFKQGAIAPHVAAGINLNFWPMGFFLRSGGAFFIRRSFSGNKTYTYTFSAYVDFLLHNSYPVEFFPEGGRSRIGKLLPPKIGMLSICLQSILHRKVENTYLMPVSIGYDKVMEDDTYAKELKGAKKQKENVLQFLNGIRKVFANYGSVDVSFGEPVLISQAWTTYVRKFETQTGQPLPENFKDLPDDLDTRDPKIQSFVKYLAYRIHQKINGAATASSTAMLSTVLLARNEKYISARSLTLYMLVLHYTVNELSAELKWEIATSKNVDNVFEYISAHLNGNQTNEASSNQLVPQLESFNSVASLTEEYVQMGKKWHLLSEKTDNENPLYFRNPEKEFNLWWYRGTTFHIFAIMGVIAKAIISCQRYQLSSLEVLFENIRRLWRDELFWDDETTNREFIISALNILNNLKVLSFDGNNIQFKKSELNLNDSEFSRQNILPFYANIIRPEVELYGLLISVALFFIEKKRFFERHELIEKATAVYENAYKQNYTVSSGTFVKIFGNTIFDALSRRHIFINTERQRFVVDMLLVGGIAEFFDLKKWKKFLG